MSSELKVDKISPATGTSTTLGDSGDTFTVPSGVTLDTSSSTLSLPSSVITGQTEKTSLVDAGKFSLASCNHAPLEGYKPSLKPEEILVGHTYYVRAADGKCYGKIHVVDFSPEGKVLSFKWQFQTNGSREL